MLSKTPVDGGATEEAFQLEMACGFRYGKIEFCHKSIPLKKWLKESYFLCVVFVVSQILVKFVTKLIFGMSHYNVVGSVCKK